MKKTTIATLFISLIMLFAACNNAHAGPPAKAGYAFSQSCSPGAVAADQNYADLKVCSFIQVAENEIILKPTASVRILAETEVCSVLSSDNSKQLHSSRLPLKANNKNGPLILSLMIPGVGRIVKYRLTSADQVKLMGNHDPGGGNVKEAPAIITNVFGAPADTSLVNLKVFGDSDNDIWVTSSPQGSQPGSWYDPRS